MNTPLMSSVQSKLQIAKDIKDEDKLYWYKGVLYPTIMCPLDHLQALERVEAREEDVMLVAYPKCGFNWMVGVLQKILAAATGVQVQSKMPPLLEFYGPEMLKVVNEAPSPRFLGTHMHPNNIPSSFFDKKTKMLVILRNPKDTMVSFYHFSNNNPVIPSAQSWDSFFSKFMSGEVAWGSYFDHVLAWEERLDDPNVMIVTYEQLKQDLSDGIRKMAEFFSFSLSKEQVQTISEHSTFKAMKDNSKDSHGGLGSVIFRKVSSMFSPFQGEVGDWRNHFSPEQSQEMDSAFHRHLAGTRLGDRLNYHLHCI